MDILAVLRYNVPFHKDFLARAYEGADSLQSAIREFEKLVSSQSTNGIQSLIHPDYHFRLAQLYLKSNEFSKAKEELLKFIDIRKDSEIYRESIRDANEQLERIGKSM